VVLFLTIYSLFHFTPLDTNKKNYLDHLEEYTNLDKALFKWLAAQIAGRPKWLLWVAIVIRWLYCAALLVGLYVVAGANKWSIWPSVPTSQRLVIQGIAFYLPFVGSALPALFWFLTKVWILKVAGENLKISPKERDEAHKIAIKNFGIAVAAALVFWIVYNIFSGG
jgi:hypothetical protein